MSKTVTLSFTEIEAFAVYTALKGLANGHQQAEHEYGKLAHDGKARIATRKALAKVELALTDVVPPKGI